MPLLFKYRVGAPPTSLYWSSVAGSLRGFRHAISLSGYFLFRIANLNCTQDISDVATGISVLVNRCLLQDMPEGYRVHDLVLEYLQLIMAMDGGRLAGTASSRQAQYLARLGVFKQYNARGHYVSTGGLYSLIALWNSAKNLDGNVNAGVFYSKSLEGVDDIEIVRDVAWLLRLLVRTFSRYWFVLDPPCVDFGVQHRSTLCVCSCKYAPCLLSRFVEFPTIITSILLRGRCIADLC